MLPTLAGLRLCTDTRFGKPEPYSQYDRVATRASNTRHLQFAPAAACAHSALAWCSSPVAAPGRGAVNSCQGAEGLPLAAPVVSIPPNASGNSTSLEAALSRLQDLCCHGCCEPRVVSGAICSDLVLETTASLARLVATAVLAGRLQLHLNAISTATTTTIGSSSSSTWAQLARVPEVWVLPARHKLAWRSAWHWLLQAAPGASATAAGSNHDDMNSPRQHCWQQQQQLPARPLVFTGFLQPTSLR
jgi:hypothetical protein